MAEYNSEGVATPDTIPPNLARPERPEELNKTEHYVLIRIRRKNGCGSGIFIA
jgi:hypothetical protein